MQPCRESWNRGTTGVQLTGGTKDSVPSVLRVSMPEDAPRERELKQKERSAMWNSGWLGLPLNGRSSRASLFAIKNYAEKLMLILGAMHIGSDEEDQGPDDISREVPG